MGATCNHPMGPVGHAPPTLGITSRTKCIWSLPTFSTDCHFCLCRHRVKLSASPDFLAKFKRRMKEERRGENGETWVEQQRKTGKGRIRKKGDWYPPHVVRPPPNFSACAYARDWLLLTEGGENTKQTMTVVLSFSNCTSLVKLCFCFLVWIGE